MYLIGNACATFASRSILVLLSFQVYKVTNDKGALGLLGIVEAIPAISVALFGGQLADRYDLRRILLVTQSVSALGCGALVLISMQSQINLFALYSVVFVVGLSRGFESPAGTAFEAKLVPQSIYIKANAMRSSAWQATAILSPLFAMQSVYYLGMPVTYAIAACLLLTTWVTTTRIKPKPHTHEIAHDESIWSSIGIGVRYVFKNQLLLGSMSLDLFAVLFGGAVALLPVFASDILRVGERELGFLTAATAAGALVAMLWATRRPPRRHANLWFLGSVAGFGLAIVGFALTTNFWLALFFLALSGALDGVSMVIRSTILRKESPEHLRGRIAAVNWIFIGSSNEIGAAESGYAAKWLGTVPSVVAGGCVTLVVVAIAALVSPKLRQLNLED